jgi:CRISPR system Cascade subunit CasD
VKTVLLRLEGALQAWATQSRFSIRDTDREPSKSGVLGLVAAALGMARDDDVRLAALARLELVVRIDRPGALLHDYQTAGGGRFRGNDKYLVHGAKDCVPTHRYLLQDASFLAGIGGDDGLVDEITGALAAPRWPLFLGRRACAPSTPVLAGVVAQDPRTAVRAALLAERSERGDPVPVRLVCDAHPGEAGDTRIDVPMSFRDGARRYGYRTVITDWLEVPKVASPAHAGRAR